jgi:hypothetical protein
MDETTGEISQTHLLFALIGAAMMVVIGVFVFASTLIAPPWAVAAMGVVWLAAAIWSATTWRRSMFAPLLAALSVGVMWIVVVNLGDALLGWTA